MTTKAAALPRRRSRVWSKVWQHRHLYLMLLIPIAFYLLFCYWPMYGIQIAFKKYNVRMGIEGSPWVGLKYFQKYLTDPYFWKVVRNTLLLNVYSLVFSFPAPILLAMLLNELRSSVYKKVVQSVSYLPHFISTVVVCGMVVNFLANSGPINDVIEKLGGTRIQFMMEAKYFRTIYIATGIWQNIGWNSIIYFAAISGVDPSLYEAMKVDGASRWQQIIHLILPMIADTVILLLIMTLGNLLNVGFEKVYLMYSPAVYETGDVIATYVYRQGIENKNFSYAAAVGLFYSAVGFVFVMASNSLSRRVTGSSLW